MIRFDPREINAAIREEVKAIRDEIASSVLGTVVLSTPVGAPGTWLSPPPPNYRPGHARGSWQTTRRNPATRDNIAIDPGGARTIANGTREIRRAKFGENIFFTSLAPYMGILNTGHSRQAGPNFIERAIARGASVGSNTRRILPASRRVRPRGGR